MRVLGVIGTMVWDEIWRDGEIRSPVEKWGGISYALAAAETVCAPELSVRPIVKMGRDLSERGFRFMRELTCVEALKAVQVVDEPNTRVELQYESDVRRCERISGGIPTWDWAELAPRVAGCDALYINFITGRELDLTTAQALRREYSGPIYADLHSLLLGIGPGGERSPRALARWTEWLACFDAVQLNEDELGRLSARWGDPWAFAADVVGRHIPLLFVTLGARGAAYIMVPGALPLGAWRRSSILRPGPVKTGRVSGDAVTGGDPTGCGDVWGITTCSALLDSDDVEAAMRTANEMASRNAELRGAVELRRALRGEIGRG